MMPLLLLQAVPQGTNPLVIAAYIAGFLLSLPFLYAIIKLVFFFAHVTTTLDSVVKGLEAVTTEMKTFRHAKNDEAQSMEFSFFILEGDVNALQKHAGLPIRQYPDRRTGAPDRRKASQ